MQSSRDVRRDDRVRIRSPWVPSTVVLIVAILAGSVVPVVHGVDGQPHLSPRGGTVAALPGLTVEHPLAAVPGLTATYPVTVHEVGLPPGTAWSVTVNGSIETSTGTSVTYTLPNGTYGFSVSPVPGYSGVWSGYPSVDGAPVSVTVAFSPSTSPSIRAAQSLLLSSMTTVTGAIAPREPLQATSLSYNPASGDVFVASADPQEIEIVNESDGGRVNTLMAFCANGSSPPDPEVQFDSANGYLYDLCGPVASVVVPSTGRLLTNLALPTPTPENASACGSVSPRVVGSGVDVESGAVFVALLSCTGELPTATPFELSLDVVNASTDIVTRLASFPTTFSYDEFLAEPLAVDPQADLVWLDTNISLGTNGTCQPNPCGYVVTTIDGATGQVLGNVSIPIGDVTQSPLLLFDPTLKAVVSIGTLDSSSSTVNNTTRESLVHSLFIVPSGAWTNPETIFNWTWSCTHTLLEPLCPADSEASWLAYSAALPTSLFVVLDGNTTSGWTLEGTVWQVDETNGTLLSSVPIEGEAYALAIDPGGDAAYLLDQSNLRVWSLATSPMRVVGSSALSIEVYQETVDRSGDMLYLAEDSPDCFGDLGILDESNLYCSPTIVVISESNYSEVDSWLAPTAPPAAMVFDPGNQDLYLYSSCTNATDGRNCLPGNATAIITAYSPTGATLYENESVPSGGIATFSSAVIDPQSGDVLFGDVEVPSPHERYPAVVLLALNVSTGEILPLVALFETAETGPLSLIVDSEDDSFYTAFSCPLLSTLPVLIDECIVQINATSYALESELMIPLSSGTEGGSVAALDTTTDTLFVPIGSALVEVRASSDLPTGGVALTGNASAAAFDSSSGMLFATDGNLSEIDPATGRSLVSVMLNGACEENWIFASGGESASCSSASNGTLILLANLGLPESPVDFQESGLPSGLTWAVTLGDQTSTGSAYVLGFVVANGSWSYAVDPPEGYSVAPIFGTLTVDGSSILQRVIFDPLTPGTYLITFTETGLPAGTNWSVILQGENHSSEGSILQFIDPNGTYSFRVGGVPGFSAVPAGGPVTVGGSDVGQRVSFSPSTSKGGSSGSGPTFLGLPPGEGYAVIGGAVAAIVVLASWAVMRRPRR